MPLHSAPVSLPSQPGPPGEPLGSRARSAGRSLLGRLRSEDRDVLWLYLASRVSVWIVAYCARWVFPRDPETKKASAVLQPFQQWDWHHYLRIAQEGYFPGAEVDDNRVAFFPGFPLVLRAVYVVIPNWTVAGLAISFVSGAIAVVALARIARRYLEDAGAGRRTVVLLLASPCAVFLAVGYTEALFLALALPAWLAAQRHAWVTASLLIALASAVRISGLFLAAALVVHYLCFGRARDNWWVLLWMTLPAFPAALYFWHLYANTGDLMAWQHAQERGWHRSFHLPWDAWFHTWGAAFDGIYPTTYAFMFLAELVGMVMGLVLLAVLVRRRSWPEATYIALGLWALGTSYWYMSVPRASLAWWPLWIGLAALTLRRPRLLALYGCLICPLSVVFALAFFTGRWAG
ncbi:mannosyltransferase family protein [Streptomyces cyaneofuscatus]|uniref:mannosyltransferase family protein n=1 Tax=Streptomyces cyaneofuscatus TaxID=66883 RepID=UPI00369E5DFF